MKSNADIPSFDLVMVDDDADDRYLLGEAIKSLRLNIHIKMFENGLELVAYLKMTKKLPDIVFLDLNMPLMNGFECLKELRGNSDYADICIVIFSTSANEKDIEETFILGANVYLIKPEDFNELKQLLNKVVLFNNHYQVRHADRQTFVMRLGAKY